MPINLVVVSPHGAATREALTRFENRKLWRATIVVTDPNDDPSLVAEAGFEAIDWRTRPSGTRGLIKKNLRKATRFVLDNTRAGVFFQARDFCSFLSTRYASQFDARSEKVVSLIKSNQAKAVFIFNDRSAGIESAAIHAARACGVPVLGLGFAISADKQSLVFLRKALIYRVTPCSVGPNVDTITYCDRRYRFYRPFETKVLREKKVLSANPWVLGCGNIDRFFIPSALEMERLISLGGPRSKYVCVGSRALGQVIEKISERDVVKHRIVASLGMPIDKKIIILALPQYYEHGFCSLRESRKIIKELITKLISQRNILLISLHPKMNPADYQWIEEPGKVRIVNENLYEYIFCGDVFVSSYSSTVEWALFSGVPVLNLDLMNQNYKNFFPGFGFNTVAEMSAIEGEVEKLLNLQASAAFPFEGRSALNVSKDFRDYVLAEIK